MTTTAKEFIEEFDGKVWNDRLIGAFITKLFTEYSEIEETAHTGIYRITFQDSSAVRLNNNFLGSISLKTRDDDEEEDEPDDDSDEDCTNDPV